MLFFLCLSLKADQVQQSSEVELLGIDKKSQDVQES